MTEVLTPRPALRGPLDAMALVGLVAIVLVPLAPRPTLPGMERVVAPALAAVLVLAAWLHVAARGPQSRPLPGPVAALVAVTGVYVVRVVLSTSVSELPHAASRVLMVSVVVAVLWLFDGVEPERLWRLLGWGTVVLAVLAAGAALTGFAVLGDPRPARTLGVSLPWFKTTGIPRSFGEQGILVAVVAAWLMGWWNRTPSLQRMVVAGSLVALVLAGQSRNMLLGAGLLVVTWASTRTRASVGRFGWFLAGGFMATFLAQWATPLLARAPVGSVVLGQGLLRENVVSRFTLADAALAFLAEDPTRSLLGVNHADWGDFEAAVLGTDVGLHSHVLSSFVFLGVVGGAVWLWAAYVEPARRMIGQLREGDLSTTQRLRRRVALTASVGVLVSLNFYEGFFSLVLALHVGVTWLLASGADLRTDRRSEP